MPRAKRDSSDAALSAVRRVRAQVRETLAQLRQEIADTEAHLEELRGEEASFREDILGEELPAAPAPTRTAAPKAPATPPEAPKKRRGRPPKTDKKPSKRGKTPVAEKYFAKLPNTFTLDQVRKLAGRASGISIAQWRRADRIKSVGDKRYQKV